jgi:hypothetical protein
VNYDITDSDFNKKLSTAYQLSILVGMDSLVYFVFDAGNDNALLLKSFSFPAPTGEKPDLKKELKDVFAKDELLGYLFRRVKIILPTPVSALVPERLYNEMEKSTYLQELTEATLENPVQTDEVPELATRVVYAHDPKLVNAIKKQFPTGKFYSPVTPFLLGCRKLMHEVKDPVVFANFLRETIQLCVFERQNLVFYNSFSYTTSGDVLYYILLVYNQFNLDPAVAPLKISGQILESADIYRTLYRYVTHLHFQEFPPFLKFGRKFADIPRHFFFDLYSLAVCK